MSNILLKVRQIHHENKASHRIIAVAGVEHVGGDMFETVPTGDAILLKVRYEILHIPI